MWIGIIAIGWVMKAAQWLSSGLRSCVSKVSQPRVAASARVATPAPSFYFLPVASTFNRAAYTEVILTLRAGAGCSMLLDLSRAVVPAGFFRALAASWQGGEIVKPTRLGVHLAFYQWATLRDSTSLYLRELERKGVQIHLFYEGQDFLPWFVRGEVVDNVEAVIRRLWSTSMPTNRWPRILDAAVSLLQVHRRQRRCARPLTDLAELALERGATDRAIELTGEALLYMDKNPCALEARALRILGLALLRRGQELVSAHVFEDAVAVAHEAGASIEAALALHQLGLLALRVADYSDAERRFREAITCVPREPSELLATLHDGLAVASLNLGNIDQAKSSGWLAVELRSDDTSPAAMQSRAFLAHVHAVCGQGSSFAERQFSTTSETRAARASGVDRAAMRDPTKDITEACSPAAARRRNTMI